MRIFDWIRSGTPHLTAVSSTPPAPLPTEVSATDGVILMPRKSGFDAAGAYYRQKDIRKVWRKRNRTPVVAELVREPRNAHDPNAIRIDVEGRHVGYVPAATAAEWAPQLDEIATLGFRVTCIVQFWTTDSDNIIGLDLKASDTDVKRALKLARESAD